jgi:hypothetical protein
MSSAILAFSEAERALEPRIITHGDPAVTQRNWDTFFEHNRAEQHLDLDATMATVHRDGPFQIYHASGLEVWGWENVRAFYRERMTVFGGRAAFPQRIVMTEDFAVIQAWFKGAPAGNFFGHQTWGNPLFFPLTIWFYFRDGLVLGESGVWDGATVERQARDGATGDVCTPLL